MFPLTVFSKMKAAIRERVIHHEPGLYLYIIFPAATIFLITFIGARLLSHFAPNAYVLWFGIHVHHFVYGFLVVAVACYLALVNSGPRAKYLISLLYGLGLGLAFDEFGMWINLDDSNPARFSYDGFLVVVAFFMMIISAKSGIKFVKNHLFFWRHPKDDKNPRA